METSGSQTVSTKLSRIAELARQTPKMVMTTLAHHIDLEWLKQAYAQTNDAAPGIDQITKREYERNLNENLSTLLERFKSGAYKAQPVKRVYIPKGDGSSMRPLGIPTLEDKILQRAVSMVLEAIYEQDFYPCSRGFRPGKNCHQALETIRTTADDYGTCYIIDADIRSFFDTIDHQLLRSFLDQRVRDGVIRKTIDKWLKAGIMEEHTLHYNDSGTPQGGVISPLLANIYLHEVLDRWIEEDVRPRLKGRMQLVRYADDFIILVDNRSDAERIMAVLPKRLRKYGLELHPEKTRLIPFHKPQRTEENRNPSEGRSYQTFDFLGFTHYWRKARTGAWYVTRKTAKTRLKRTLKRISEWCKANRHRDIRWQWEKLTAKLRGHYHYFGVTNNGKALKQVLNQTERIWRKWLNRRSQRRTMSWERFEKVLKILPLPPPKITHSIYHAANP